MAPQIRCRKRCHKCSWSRLKEEVARRDDTETAWGREANGVVEAGDLDGEPFSNMFQLPS